MNYEPIIGLEVHLQPKTQTKMFCRCSSEYFGKAPNTHTCPVCLGLPGALPVPNKKALEMCIKLGLAMKCSIAKESKFDRKHYFYPDLPKGYQISQYDQPVAFQGYLELDIAGDARRIRVTRVHMEEDTGKSMHEGEFTLLDYNKSGVPLIELVTEPDFTSVEEVLKFSKRLRQIVRYLDISDADMEKGQMRYELNMSLRKVGERGLPNYKVEVKNISSISVLEKVIGFEFERQSALLEKGERPAQETRGIRDLTGATYSQRVKEGADDYRYFPEPDIPPMEFSPEEVAIIAKTIIELPHEKKNRFMGKFGFEPDTAETLIQSKKTAFWFERGLVELSDNESRKEFAKLLISDVFGLLKAEKMKLTDLKFTPNDLAKLAAMIIQGKLPRSAAKHQVIPEMFTSGKSLEEIIKAKGLDQQLDEVELKSICQQVVASSAKIIANLDKNPNAIKALIGQVMGRTKGKADPVLVDKLLKELLGR
ncbi:MAG: Asp-tRNA(Asn)/Glu-tRNA(Gln) amidotransferase subunit GatB [bacterium]